MPVIMSQTRFQLRPDGLIMVQAKIHSLDYNKHVTIDLILDTGASFTTINPDVLSDLGTIYLMQTCQKLNLLLQVV